MFGFSLVPIRESGPYKFSRLPSGMITEIGSGAGRATLSCSRFEEEDSGGPVILYRMVECEGGEWKEWQSKEGQKKEEQPKRKVTKTHNRQT